MRRTGFVLAYCKRAKLVGLGTSLSPHSLIRYLVATLQQTFMPEVVL